MNTKIVRINGTLFRVPAEELTDPDRFKGDPCDAPEPAPYGGAVCTLAPHDSDVMHIAHDGEWNVIAMWGYPTQATITDA